MTIIFPSVEWLHALEAKLNSDARYADIAKNWEGDIAFDVQPSGPIKTNIYYYFDLWHGKCRRAAQVDSLDQIKPAFLMRAPYENITKIVKGELDPMQALMTRKLQLHGNMAVMMRNVPVVLDFVRCAREVTSEILT
jgi:putative sterol carrier protein